MRTPSTWPGLGAVALLLGAPALAQEVVRDAPADAARLQDVDAWLAALGGKDELDREIARRRLSIADSIPTDRVAALLRAADGAVVVAAAQVLRARGAADQALRALARHPDEGVRAVVLPLAADTALAEALAGDDVEALRIAALHQLEDRGKLTDAMLLAAVRSDLAELADAATRLIVFERSPFPLQIADQILEVPAARRRLITWLADRPRARSGPWLLKVLNTAKLDPLERLLAINSLPPDWLDLDTGREVLGAALDDRPALSNRASYAADRLPPRVADQLAAIAIGLVKDEAKPIDRLLPCLSRVTDVGERQLFDLALAASDAVRKDIFHWLAERRSRLVDRYVVQALDGAAPFPPELVALTASVLTTPARVAKVIEVLGTGGRPGAEAYEALLEAGVYRPEMVAYAAAGVDDDLARRYSRLFKLPADELPLALFRRVLDLDDANVRTYAVYALSRAPLDKSLERLLLDLALRSMVPSLKVAAGRALILQGSEAAGRQVWRERRGDELTIRWLIQKPKPWSAELLLQLREGLAAEKQVNPARYHQVLIALAQLGDRGASEDLFAEIPRLAPAELQQAQKLMGRFYKAADLERLARKYLVVQKKIVTKDLPPGAPLEEDARAALLEWFIRRPGLDLDAILTDLWQNDASYEVRLVALRGLLGRDSAPIHARLLAMLERPWGEAQRELAFEVVGSMAHPMTPKALDLLARILLLAPLSDPSGEIRLAILQGYDSVRGAYPLVRPATNLLRRDAKVTPRAAFAAVADTIGERRYALNRQRLGLLLAGIQLNERLAADLGPILARLIVAAPDRSRDFLGPAQMILADAARARGDDAQAAELYTAANRAFCRGAVPDHVRRSFFGDVDSLAGYHPYAALAAQAPLCRARLAFAAGRTRDGSRQLGRARDLAEGDAQTIKQIDGLRRANRK